MTEEKDLKPLETPGVDEQEAGRAEERLKALLQREQEVEQRERRLQAQEMLSARGLPMEALPLMDLSGEAGLQKSLEHLEAFCRKWQGTETKAPKIYLGKPDQRNLSYPERALLYLQGQ